MKVSTILIPIRIQPLDNRIKVERRSLLSLPQTPTTTSRIRKKQICTTAQLRQSLLAVKKQDQ